MTGSPAFDCNFNVRHRSPLSFRKTAYTIGDAHQEQPLVTRQIVRCSGQLIAVDYDLCIRLAITKPLRVFLDCDKASVTNVIEHPARGGESFTIDWLLATPQEIID